MSVIALTPSEVYSSECGLVHGHTAAEIIYERADADKDFMGLTTWTGALPTRTDAEYAKNS